MKIRLLAGFGATVFLLTVGCSDGDLGTKMFGSLPQPMDGGAGDAGLFGNLDHGPELDDGSIGPDVAVDRDARTQVDMQPPRADAAMMAAPDSDLPPDPGVNAGWIGGPCSRDQDCTYEEAFCLTEADGYPRGHCSLDCERLCPDRDGMPVTFCVGEVVAGNGACVQRCDYDVFPGDGCRPGYHCETRSRYNEMSTGRGVCIPGVEQFMPGGSCFDELNARGLNFEQRAPISDAVEGRPNLRCVINDTIRLSSPVNGVNFQYLDRDPAPMTMSCRLGVAIHALAQVLAEYNIVAVGHIGTYNCRAISGTERISQHGLGLAIDIKWFRDRNGRVYDVEDHWEHGVTRNFRTPEAEFLYTIAQEMHTRRIFNIVLTPEYNAAHDNHFHVDLTEGSHFIGTLSSRSEESGCGHIPDSD